MISEPVRVALPVVTETARTVPVETQRSLVQTQTGLLQAMSDLLGRASRAGPAPRTESSPTRDEIRLTLGESALFGPENSKDPKFEMALAGQRIKRAPGDQDKPMIRTKIVVRDIAKSLDPQDSEMMSEPKEIKGYEAVKCSTSDLEKGAMPPKLRELLAKTDPRESVYRFDLKLDVGTHRLSSASPNDRFLALMADDPRKIKIHQGSDGFFYAEVLAPCRASYLLAFDPSAKKTLKDFFIDFGPEAATRAPADGAESMAREVARIIKDYAANGQKVSASQEIPTYSSSGHAKWLQDLYELGERKNIPCRHRVAAIEYQLSQKHIPKESYRVVGINGNHVLIEFLHKGVCYQLDLGGTQAEIIKVDKKYHSRPLKLAKSKVAEPAALKLSTDLPHRTTEVASPLAEPTPPRSSVTPTESSSLSDVEAENPLAKLNTAARQAIRHIIEPKEIVRDAEELRSKFGPDGLVRNALLFLRKEGASKEGPTEDCANLLLLEARKLGRPIFYIDSAAKLAKPNKKRIFIAEDEKVLTKAETELQEFIERARESKDPQPIILINWDAFPPAAKIRMNSIIDKKRSVLGMEIPDHVQVVGICGREYPKDSSFLSRHDSIMQSSIEAEQFRTTTSELLQSFAFESRPERAAAAPTEIDFQGYPDWKAVLFGRVPVNGTKASWKKSEFAKHLLNPESRVVNFKFYNIAAESKKELEYLLNQAKAVGYVTHHGFRIPVPADLTFSFAQKEFDFADLFSKKNPIYNITTGATVNFLGFSSSSSAVSADSPALVNSTNFDRLIRNIEIAPTKEYFEQAGIIEGASKEYTKAWVKRFLESQQKTRFKKSEAEVSEILTAEVGRLREFQEKGLPLFITTDLSKSQWYCLLKLAIEHDVKLNLQIASNVSLPEEIKTACRDVIRVAPDAAQTTVQPTIYVTNSAEQTLRKTLKPGSGPLIIDIEDYGYNDLIRKIKFTIPQSDEVAFTFEEIESDLRKVIAGAARPVVLKGRFDPALLEALQPMLAECRNKLILIAETPDHELAKTSESLRFMGARCEQQRFARTEARKPLAIEEEIPAEYAELSEDASNKFIAGRKRLLRGALTGSSMIVLTGEAGVGKSTLMKKMTEEPGFVVHSGLGAFEKFAEDNEGKTSILFIDESNLHDKHLTMFSPLKPGGSREILYDGKLYKLGPNHKVVFACNDLSYGGRFKQKLFEDGSIDEIKLARLPDSYLYSEVLKKGIYEGLSADAKKIIPEDEFKKICQHHLVAYNHALDLGEKSAVPTPRDLQEKVLRDLVIGLRLDLVAGKKAPTNHYVTTSATAENEQELKAFLKIREMQRYGEFPTAGKNGTFLKGEVGIGKSEMARMVLGGMGYDEGTPDELLKAKDGKKYYRITADLSSDQISQYVIKAFELGAIVFIDEINSCHGPDLEYVLNKVLTGEHPVTGKEAKPGFGLIATGNPISHEGRMGFSPALLSRMNVLEFKPLAKYPKEDLAKIAEVLLKEKKFSATPAQVNGLADMMADLIKDPDLGPYISIRIIEAILGESQVRKRLRELAVVDLQIAEPGPVGFVARAASPAPDSKLVARPADDRMATPLVLQPDTAAVIASGASAKLIEANLEPVERRLDDRMEEAKVARYLKEILLLDRGAFSTKVFKKNNEKLISCTFTDPQAKGTCIASLKTLAIEPLQSDQPNTLYLTLIDIKKMHEAERHTSKSMSEELVVPDTKTRVSAARSLSPTPLQIAASDHGAISAPPSR